MSDWSLGDRQVNPTPLGSIGAQDLLRVAYTKYGFLRKQNKISSKIEKWTGKSMKWSRVFVIISKGCVYIYDNDKSKTIKNAFSLQGYDRVGRMDMKGIPNSFAIYPERYYDDARNVIQFAAATEGDRLEWMQCLYGCLLLVNKETPPDGHVLRSLDYDTIERSITSTDPKNADSKDSYYDSIDEFKIVKEQKPRRYNSFPVVKKTTPKTRREATLPSTRKSTPSFASAGIEYDDTSWSTKTSPPLPDLTGTKKKPLPVYTGEAYDDTIAGPSTSSPSHDAIRDKGGATGLLPRSDSIYVNAPKENEDDDNDDSSSDSDGRSYENELNQIRDKGGATGLLPRSDSIYVNAPKENEDDDNDDSSSDSDGRSYENELNQIRDKGGATGLLPRSDSIYVNAPKENEDDDNDDSSSESDGRSYENELNQIRDKGGATGLLPRSDSIYVNAPKENEDDDNDDSSSDSDGRSYENELNQIRDKGGATGLLPRSDSIYVNAPKENEDDDNDDSSSDSDGRSYENELNQIRDKGGATGLLPRSDSIYVNAPKENEDDDNDDSSSDSDGRSYENELNQDYMFPYCDTKKAKECLQDKPINTFLIRDSTAGGKKTLQMKMKDGINKYQINIENGQYYFHPRQKFDSLDGLVKYSQTNDMSYVRLGFGYKHYEKVATTRRSSVGNTCVDKIKKGNSDNLSNLIPHKQPVAVGVRSMSGVKQPRNQITTRLQSRREEENQQLQVGTSLESITKSTEVMNIGAQMDTTLLLFQIIYKSCFEDYVYETYEQACCCSISQIRHGIQHITIIAREKSQYRIFDALFALYLALVAKRGLPVHNSRLMRLTERVVPKTSSPSQADCMYKSMIAQLLRKHGRQDEAICLAVGCIKTLNLDLTCTFNCARILDLANALREKFQRHNDFEVLNETMAFVELGSAQLRDDTTTLSCQLNEELRDLVHFYVVRTASRLIAKDSVSSLNEELIDAIVSADASACFSTINGGAELNLCLQALIQVIKSRTSILYQESNFYGDSKSTFCIDQKKVIEYFMSLDITEEIIEEGLSLFCHIYDNRREFILSSISRKLQNSMDDFPTSKRHPRVQHGRFVEDNIEKECFLVFVDTNENIQNRYYAGKTVIFRNPFRISYEGITVAMMSLRSKNILPDSDYENIKETISRESEKLWNEHTNLNIISACSIKSKQNGQITQLLPCIVLYCTCKGFIPNVEPRFPKVLPSRNGDIVVDVREGYFTLGCGNRPSDWNSPLRMGGSVGLSNRMSAGTIGPFIALPQNKTGFLTCAHVFLNFQQLLQNAYNNNVCTNMTTVQPSDVDFTKGGPNGETRDCGRVGKCIFNHNLPTGIDAAMVEITHRQPERGLFAFNSEDELDRAGFTNATHPIFDTGSIIEYITSDDRRCSVVKFGCKSGLTSGTFELDGTQVRIRDKPFDVGAQLPVIFKGMYEIRCCINDAFKQGDSGSGVFLVENKKETLHCIGIAIGSTDYGATIVEPIGPVLDVLFDGTRPKSLKQFLLPAIDED